MADQRYVRPAVDGRKVEDPDRRQNLPRWGALVTWSPYWQKALEDGRVVLVERPEPSVEARKTEPEPHGARRGP